MKEIVTKLESFVEKAARPGVLGVVGRRLEKRATQEIGVYFRALKVNDLAQLANAVKEKHMGKHIAKLRLHNILRKARPMLQLVLKTNLYDAVVAARKHEHVVEAADQPFNQKGTTLFDAVKWAEQQAADLITGLDATTAELISDAVAEGIEEQLGVDGTGRLIRATVDDMAVSRAAMIASTEMNRAMSTATVEQLNNLGVEYKRIILSPEACDICVDNEAAGPIPIDDDFDSGDAYPPFHPNCRCAVTAARAPEE
jgi:hypothetical protein